MQRFFLLFILTITYGTIFSQEENVLGIWLTQDKTAHIKIYKDKGKYFGKVIWLKDSIDPETKKPRLDRKNPDKSKRNNPAIGLTILSNFTYKDGKYVNGKAYHARMGKIFKSKMWLVDKNTLRMRGYWGILYKTETWLRVK